LALRGERSVGRISAQVDRVHLERHADATGHFGFLVKLRDPLPLVTEADQRKAPTHGSDTERHLQAMLACDIDLRFS
jgi:hypothetical protein